MAVFLRESGCGDKHPAADVAIVNLCGYCLAVQLHGRSWI